MSFDADLGPVNYVVVNFASAPVPTGGLDKLVAMVDAGEIIVLDVEFVMTSADGVATTVPAAEVGAAAFAGASAGLIDADDIAMVAAGLTPGGVGVVVVYEDLTLPRLAQAWEAEGGTIVTEGPVIVDELVLAIDTAESTEESR